MVVTTERPSILFYGSRDLCEPLARRLVDFGAEVGYLLTLEEFARRPDVLAATEEAMGARPEGVRALVARNVATEIVILGSAEGGVSCADMLNAGADDYIGGVHEAVESVARLRVALRRAFSRRQTLRLGTVRVEQATREVFCGDRRIWPSPHEYDLLCLLMRRPRTTVPLDVIARVVWGHEAPASVDTYKQAVRSLRRKLANGGAVDVIQTVLGKGYRMDGDAAGNEPLTFSTEPS